MAKRFGAIPHNEPVQQTGEDVGLTVSVKGRTHGHKGANDDIDC